MKKHHLLFSGLTAVVVLFAGGQQLLAGGKKDVTNVTPDWKTLRIIKSDCKFTEGPAIDMAGNVYFNDIPNNITYKMDSEGKISEFRKPSNHSNGLMVNAKGEIVACEMDGRVVAVSADGKKVRVLAAKFKDKRFNAPNDLVIDRDGGVYFTDPFFRAPKPLPQGKTCVYYISNKREVTRLIENLAQPNGVIMSPDEKTLYVVPSRQKQMMAYPILAPGKLGKGRVLCELRQMKEEGNRGGDGLAVDVKGNLYITTQLGLQVFSPAGKLLAVLEFPLQPANVTFGGKDLRTLYVTARSTVYSVRMPIAGHAFAILKK